MQKLRILRKSIFLIFAFFLVTLIFVRSVATSHKATEFSNPKVAKTTVDPYALKLYQSQQNALSVALTAYFKKAIAAGDLVGAGVSIVKGDSIIFSDGFGKRNVKLNDPVDGETVFRLGSLSKGFAGILAAKLQSEGVIDWTDKVSDFVPDFQLGDSINTNQITLATILSQTSGAPYHSYTDLVEAGLPLTEIAKRFKQVTPISKPGMMYSYQNAMFALSGEMMHQATHQDLTTLLYTKFFKPLDMHTISMDNETLTQNKNVALPHSKSRYGWKTLKLRNNYYNAVAAGGINASATDMAKWMQLLLGHHPELMDKAALAEAFNPFIEIKGHSKYYQRWPGHVSSFYGFGWRIHNYTEQGEQHTMFHHGGSVNNYRNEIAVFPDSDMGICVLLSNTSKLAKTVIPDLYKIASDIFKTTSLNDNLTKSAIATSME